jgi:hypothetical protein
MSEAAKVAEAVRAKLTGHHGISDARAESGRGGEYVVVVYSDKSQLVAARKAVSEIAGTIEFTFQPAPKNGSPPTPVVPKSVTAIPTYPYTLRGVTSSYEVDRAEHDSLPPIMYVTEEELRGLNSAYGEVFHLSLKHDMVIGIATGALPAMDYVVTKWSRRQYGAGLPGDKKQLAEVVNRHYVVPGLRAAYDAAKAELRTLLEHGKEKNILIFDTTYAGKGITTLVDTVVPLAKTLGNAKITVAAIIDRSRRTKKLPAKKEMASDNVEIVNIVTDRVVTEDIPEALGREKLEPAKIGGVWSNGIVLVQSTKHSGHMVLTTTLSAAVAKLIERPSSLRRDRRRPITNINDVVFSLVDEAKEELLAGKFRKAFQKFLDGKLSAFELGGQLRPAIHGGLVWLDQRKSKS